MAGGAEDSQRTAQLIARLVAGDHPAEIFQGQAEDVPGLPDSLLQRADRTEADELHVAHRLGPADAEIAQADRSAAGAGAGPADRRGDDLNLLRAALDLKADGFASVQHDHLLEIQEVVDRSPAGLEHQVPRTESRRRRR